MRRFDTTPAAFAVQETAHRHLGQSGRLNAALELSNLARSFAEAGIRRRHPEYTDDQIAPELARELYQRSA